MRARLINLFDSDTVSIYRKPLPVNEIAPTKLDLKTNLNSHGDQD